jgi:hypothetical protein
MDRRATDRGRQRANGVAEAVLDDRTTVLEAAGELVSLAHTDAIANEEDRILIIAIPSMIVPYSFSLNMALTSPFATTRARP